MRKNNTSKPPTPPETPPPGERDTHFLRSAECLAEELAFGPLAPDFAFFLDDKEALQGAAQMIARYAYDLLVHDRMHSATIDLQHAASRLEAEEMVNAVPDRPDWPDTQEGEHHAR